MKRDEMKTLGDVCVQHVLPLIIDEVFVDYGFNSDERRATSTAAHEHVLTFTLNGISKSCGLPQLKLGWIVVSGNDEEKAEALQRLEIVADTFLSVNTPVQVALPQLLRSGEVIRQKIRKRVEANVLCLKKSVDRNSPISLLDSEGGWYAIIKIPKTKSEEEWALHLLDDAGVFVFPGYFFEVQESGFLVLSLLPDEEIFSKGIELLTEILRRAD